jgi:hypothetical protein
MKCKYKATGDLPVPFPISKLNSQNAKTPLKIKTTAALKKK